MAPPMGPPPTISVQDSDNEGGLSVRRNSRPVSINFGASLESEYCRGLYDYDANGPDELSFKEDDVIHIVSRNPNGCEDGWWMGECNGRTGLFPSIVVEESQADGSDWSPDVSVCGSPPAFDAPPPPPCFGAPPKPPPPTSPPSVTSPPRPPPPTSAPSVPSPPSTAAPTLKSGPPARPPVPTIVMASSSSSKSSSPSSESEQNEDKANGNEANLATETQIMITNPTPLVENEADPREDDKNSSYYVKDSSFSMNMSDDKKDKYQNSVPVEVNVVVEPMKPLKIKVDSDDPPAQRPAAPSLATTEIVVTAPTPRTSLTGTTEIVLTAATPRTQSPEQEDQEPLFTCTSESESEAAPAAAVGDAGDGGDWANFGAVEQKEDDKPAADDWANFGASSTEKHEEEEKAVEEEKPAEDWASFSDNKPSIPEVSVTKPDPEPAAARPSIVRPSIANNVMRQVRIVETETSDSESEFINTNLQVAADDTDVGGTTTDAGPDSSDTESDDHDDRKTARDSSDTESASDGPEDTSRETPSPRPAAAAVVPQPPEQLEPKQLKKLETMKESPA